MMDIRILRHLCVICLLSGLLGVFISATPFGRNLEERFGLAFLFTLRGERMVPDEAVIFAIEKKSADFFGLKQQPYKWPRTIHAQAVDRLSALGAAAIGFDLFFEETRSEADDREFARAIQKSGRVVLLQRLHRAAAYPDEPQYNAFPQTFPRGSYISEQLIPAVPLLEEQAAGLAPFPLPRTPVRLNQAWLFKEGAGEKATLPTAMFAMSRPELLAKFTELIRLAGLSASLSDTAPFTDSFGSSRLDILLQKLKIMFLSDATLGERMKRRLASEKNIRLESLTEDNGFFSMLRIFDGDRSLFINYYGPPGTINSVPYYLLFEDTGHKDIPNLQGKAVFIGLTHDAEMGEKDGFYTIFTNSEGKDISGVEVAATIFANLVDGSIITPISSYGAIALIFALGMGIGTISQTLPPTAAGAIGLCLCLTYICLAYTLFIFRYLWVPLVVPIMVQAPLTHLAVTLCKYKKTLLKKRNIAKALQCYIPQSIAAELEQDFTRIVNTRDEVHGICLYSDLENYTVLAENSDHAELTQRINSYYEEMFRVVKQYSGMVLDIRGDSMLALWANNDSGGESPSRACQAALAISAIFNSPHSIEKHHLPTRIGLHRGNISLGNIGALDHFQYTITGDTVNTVARIESFNKQLGTRLLVSDDIADTVADFAVRKMGTFLFVGKNRPLTIYELIGRKIDISSIEKELSASFAEGLENFEAGQWRRAAHMFARCSAIRSDYGPALWFTKLCKRYMESSMAANWDGVIRLEQK